MLTPADHLVHHMLSLFALGATPPEIQDMWDYNRGYQAPIDLSQGKAKAEAAPNLDLSDPALFDQCLGREDAYADFLRFFENEIEKKGVEAVVREYMLKGDERADDIFCRMYTGESCADG